MKRIYRFFGGMLNTQERWLNKMADNGYRLVKTGKLLYEFEECRPRQKQYCVEFIANKSKSDAEEYRCFLEDMGYRVFYKNINYNYSVGKIRLRPWADIGGRIATNSTTYNREILIVEKENDGKPFQLHTTAEDKLSYCKNICKPYIFSTVAFAALGIVMRSFLFGAFAAVFAVPLIFYAIEIKQIKKQAEKE